MQRLGAEPIVVPTWISRRNWIFEAREVVDAYTDLERQLASPVGDTAVTPPSHPVPYRRGWIRGAERNGHAECTIETGC